MENDVIDLLIGQHMTIRDLFVEDMGPDAPEFDDLFATLRAEVVEHAHHEESYEFRYLRARVPAVQLRALVPMVRAAEAIAPTHPHPRVESATANNLAGPVLSLFDRAKDLVRSVLTKKE